MKILLHEYKKNKIRSRLKTLIESELTEIKIVLTDSQSDLSQRLSRPLHNFSVLIVIVEDLESIRVLLSLKPLFENIKLILIFCKRIDGFKEPVLLLEPLYTKLSGDNFMDVISVVKRIKERYESAGSHFEISDDTNF